MKKSRNCSISAFLESELTKISYDDLDRGDKSMAWSRTYLQCHPGIQTVSFNMQLLCLAGFLPFPCSCVPGYDLLSFHFRFCNPVCAWPNKLLKKLCLSHTYRWKFSFHYPYLLYLFYISKWKLICAEQQQLRF